MVPLRLSVRIITCGACNVYHTLPTFLREQPAVQDQVRLRHISQMSRRGSSEVQRGSTDIIQVFSNAGVVNQKESVVVIDARGFADARGSSRYHVGLSPDIQAALATSRHFAPWFRQVRATLEAVMARPQRPAIDGVLRIAVVVFCKSGNHRSVGLSALLSKVLLQVGFTHDPVPVWHLTEAASVWRTHHCGPCANCLSSAPEKRAAALAAAVEAWHSRR